MTDKMDLRMDEILDGDPDPRQFRPQRTRSLIIGVVAILIIVIAAVSITLFAINSHENAAQSSLRQRLVTLAQGRVDVITTWREGVVALAGRVVDDGFYKDFATEMDLSVGDISKIAAPAKIEKEDEESFDVSFSDRIELMQNVLIEYVRNTGFLAGHLMNREGSIIVTTDFNFVLNPTEATHVQQVFKTGKPFIAPTVAQATGFVMDMYLPIFPVQETEENIRVVGVLLLSRPITEKVAEFLKPSPFSLAGESIHILQLHDGNLEELRPGSVPPIVPLGELDSTTANFGLNYRERLSLKGEEMVYSLALTVPNAPWVLVQETRAATALKDLQDYIQTIIAIAFLVVISVIVAFGAFWWRMTGEHKGHLADQFKALASRIAAQKQFVDSVNNTIQDYIGVKDRDGTYRYANPAFADAIGRPLDRLLGLDDDAIFGHGTAERLKLSDQRALENGQAVTVDEEIYLESKKHYMQISKVPLRDENGVISGLVSVTRDITDIVEQRQKRELAIKQTVVALIRAIELRDPYLAGHSRRLAGFSGQVAKHLGAEPAQVSTIEVAANLSQIGKLSISRKLLSKPDRLSVEEIEIIHRHVEHAATILRDLDFGLPVFQAIYQMNERLDGTGYPKGLPAEEISLEARVLAVCDVFCARVEPRSYRPAIPPLEAIEILEGNGERYDLTVVAALRAIVLSPAGDRLMQDLQQEDLGLT
jgi:PAS domain S-box-containing protein